LRKEKKQERPRKTIIEQNARAHEVVHVSQVYKQWSFSLAKMTKKKDKQKKEQKQDAVSTETTGDMWLKVKEEKTNPL
jgi:hypothetical protein